MVNGRGRLGDMLSKVVKDRFNGWSCMLCYETCFKEEDRADHIPDGPCRFLIVFSTLIVNRTSDVGCVPFIIADRAHVALQFTTGILA